MRCLPSPAIAQTAPTSDPAVVPPPPAQPVTATGKLVYTPADFARFAPKTAYDMLIQVPSFTIRAASTDRGLGQASENVLINGERITNKDYSGGGGGAVDELHRVAISNVDRIEIVDAASLGIAGLSGQVANVILKAKKGSSGQFEWRPDFRAHYSKPNLFRGSVSYTGTAGPVDYTLSVKDQAGRGAFGGPIVIYDRNRVVTERRHEVYHSESDLVTFQTKFKLDGPGSSVGNLSLGYTPYWAPTHIRDRRDLVTGVDRARTTVQKLDGWYYDVNADYEFALGPGRLKLIGLQHRDHEPVVTTQVTRFDDGSDPDGVRFSRNSIIRETIGRGEYHWKTGKNDWQVTFERAFNSLDQKGGLFILQPSGEFEEVAFPEGTGKVQEVRYESIATLSRPLTSNLDLQVAAGAEISHLDRTDDELPAAQILPAQGQRHARLAAGQGLGREPQAAPQGRADQLLRFPRPAQAGRRPRERRQSRPGAAAELGGRRRGRQGARPVGQDPPSGLGPFGHRHRRRHSARQPYRRHRQSAACDALRCGKHEHHQFRSDRLEGRQARRAVRVRKDQRQGSADRRQAPDQRSPGPLGQPQPAARRSAHPARLGRRTPVTATTPRTSS